MSQNIDWTNFKTWIPDYANQQATNKWASSTTWTNNQGRGFVFVWLYSYNTTGPHEPVIWINGKQVHRAIMEAYPPNNARATGNSFVIPVADGDVINYTGAGSINVRQLYFIPGRWV